MLSVYSFQFYIPHMSKAINEQDKRAHGHGHGQQYGGYQREGASGEVDKGKGSEVDGEGKKFNFG